MSVEIDRYDWFYMYQVFIVNFTYLFLFLGPSGIKIVLNMTAKNVFDETNIPTEFDWSQLKVYR